MQINALCKQLALQDVFEEFEVGPGSGFLYFELLRLWDRTGLRRADLETALAEGLSNGKLAELYTHEGRMAILTEAGHRAARHSPDTLHQIEEQARAFEALEWARQRHRSGPRQGRRRSDLNFH